MLESARHACREGHYAEAEVLCRDLLERTTTDGKVPYLLGLVLHHTGREAEAEQWLRHAAALDPRSPNAYYALGCVYAATGKAASAADAFAATPHFVPLTGRRNDFYDTAGCLGRMDLVLSVDTAVAHLAVALGKPTWTLLHHPGDWRWLLERTDSHWYPAMRLFRQPQSGQWPPVIARVAEELGRWATAQNE